MAPSPTEKKDAEAVRDYSAAWTAIMRLARAGSSWSGRERHCAFLNCGDVEQGARFANVSAVSGLDFPDDGRALAVTDWDGDGDLDLWARNRNAPHKGVVESGRRSIRSMGGLGSSTRSGRASGRRL